VKILYLEAIERYTTANDLLTLIILLVLLLLVLAKKMFQPRFEDFLSLITSGKYMVIKSREHKALFGFNVLMLIIHILSISLFLFILYRAFVPSSIEDTGMILLRIITGYSFFVLLKIFVEKIIANVFDIDDYIDHYLFQKHTYRNFISIMLFPVSIFLVYADNWNNVFLYIIIGLFFMAMILTFVRIIIKNERQVASYWFYFILYLCALEIAPYIILHKLITTS
jgi:hypothetical protein